MKIPTIKKTNEEFEKKFLEYSGKNDYCLEEGWYLKKGNNCQVIWSIKQFYQDKMLKILKPLWKRTHAIYPCSGGRECENYKSLTRVNRDIAKLLSELKERIKK